MFLLLFSLECCCFDKKEESNLIKKTSPVRKNRRLLVGRSPLSGLLSMFSGDKKQELMLLQQKFIREGTSSMKESRMYMETWREIDQTVLGVMREFGRIEGDTLGVVEGITSALRGAGKRQTLKIAKLLGEN